MARSTTSAQDTALAASDRQTSVRVKLEDPDGTMADIGDLSNEDFFDGLTISAHVDNLISTAQIRLWRAAAALSLAPLMEGSTLNRSGSTYAPFLNPSRRVEIEVATKLAGQTPSGGEWVLIWEGYVDEVDWSAERIVLNCRDPVSQLNDRIVESVGTYGGGSPLADIEDVMQAILNDHMGSGAFPLVVVGDPDFGVDEYELGHVSVLDALVALRDLQGWNLHWKWDPTASPEGFFLTYYEPVRNAAELSGYSPDYTFGPDDYYSVDQLSLSARGIRNAGEVVYTDSAGDDQTVSDDRSSSIATYGRRFIRLDERGGAITTAGQANALLAAVLDDLESPGAIQRIEAAFHWPIEIGDMHRYSANGVHYDTDQDWAVVGYQHVIEPDRVRTRIDVAGKPSGGYARWHRREALDRERRPRLDATFEPRIVPATVGGVAGAHIDISYDLAPAVSRVHFQYSYDDGAPQTVSYNVALSGQGVHRLQFLGSDALFEADWTDIEILCRVNNNSFDPDEVGVQHVFSYPDIFAGGEGVRVELTAGGQLSADHLTPGTGVTIDTDANGRPRINSSGGGAAQLSDLSDVNTSTPTDRNVLVADGVDWESRALEAADVQSGAFGASQIDFGDGLRNTSGQLAVDIDGLTDVSTETAPDDVAKGTDQLAFSRGAALFKDTFNTIPLSIFDDDITGGALETASTGLTAVGSDVQVEYTGGADSLVGAAADGTGGGDLETTDRILFADDSDLFDVKFALVDQLPFTSNVGDITDVTAGDGLVGGGASGAVTLDVDPGDGIVISGDAVTVNPDEGISVGAGGVRLDIDGLTDVSTESAPDDELLGTDQIVFSRGASLFKDTANTIPLSAFLDDITGGGLETASTGLTTVGSDVQVEYTGSVDSVIGAAPDFTGTIAGADNILIADGGNTGDVKAVSLAEIDVGVFDDDGTYLTPGEAVTSVGAATGLDSSGGTTPQISLSFDELADRTLDDTDKLVFYSPGGAGHFTDIVSGIGLSNFLNDAGFSSGALETASTGLTTVGSDVQVEYTGSVDSIIGAAPDFTGTVSSADNILIADGGNTGDVFAVSLAEVEGELSIGASQITAGTFGSGNYTIQGALFLEDADPQYFLTETDAALNEKRWRIVAASGSLFFQGREDQGETFANPTFMRFRRSGTSAVGVDFSGAPLRAVNGTQGAPSYAFVNDTDTGIFRPSSDILGLVAGGNEHLRIDGASTTNRVSVRSAQFYVEEQGSVLESATVTPDFDGGNQVRITNDGTVTEIDVSTSGIQHGGSYILIIEAQTGTPQSSITWTGVDGWENGEPELTQTVGDATLVLLLSSAGLGVMGSWRHIVA